MTGILWTLSIAAPCAVGAPSAAARGAWAVPAGASCIDQDDTD